MKHTTVTLALVALALLTPAGQALATGNVLVPDNTTPSLGSLFQSDTTPANTAPPAAPTPAPAAPTLPELVPPATTALPFTHTPMQPTQVPATTTIPIASPTLVPSGGTYKIEMPTTIIHLPPPIVMPNYPNAAKPTRTVTVAIAVGNSWSDGDLSAVSQHLGIDPAQIPTLCYLSANGLIMTDGTPVFIDTASTLQEDVGYNGTIKSVMVTVRAMCDAVKLPPNMGYIQQMGDKYITELGIVNCAAPANNPSAPQHINLIRDTGSFMGRCDFK